MNKFFKYFLAVIFGSMVSAFFIIIGFVMFIGVLAASTSKEIVVKDNTVLVLDLNTKISERSSSDPFDVLFSEISGQKSAQGLNQILASIKKAKDDERIMGIYLDAGLISTGYATIEEIRNALLDFRESGKFVISYAPVYSQRAYYLASAAERVYLNPTGMLEFKGLSSSYTFYKGTLEKLGVDMQIFKYGEFKSAVEPYMLESMSDAARLQTRVYLNSMWDHLSLQIAAARNLDVEAVKSSAEFFPTFRDDSLMITLGIIDAFCYKDQVIDELKSLTGTDESKDVNSIDVRNYADVHLPGKRKPFVKEKIAIIYAEGEIDGNSGGIDSEKLSRTIRKARRDSTIHAMVLRINSPGGSVLGSENIWREVELSREVKPVVVSMGDLAASGGYYIACAADTIIAHPTTLTGSIGVFGIIPNTKDLLKKVGVTTDRVKTNTFSDMPSLDRPLTSNEKELMQSYVDRTYLLFLKRCADGRNTTVETIDKIGEGRVWSGDNALGIDLVDKLGGIDDAIAVAARMADLESYRIVELPEILSPFEQFMQSMSGDAKARLGKLFFSSKEYEVLRVIEDLTTSYPVQARIPYDIYIN